MTNNQMNQLWNAVSKAQAEIYRHDQSFQEAFFPDCYNAQTYVAEIAFGDRLVFVKLGHTKDGAFRKTEIDSEDFSVWLEAGVK